MPKTRSPGARGSPQRALSAPVSVLTPAPALAPAGSITWQQALCAWEVGLQSAATRATYTGQVRAFFGTVGVPALDALDFGTLYAYAGSLRLRASSSDPHLLRLAPATVNLKLAALRSFLHFCTDHEWIPPALTADKIARALERMHAQVQRPYQIVESGDELEALLEAAEFAPYDAPRARALVALALGAGLRIAELVALDVGDLANDATSCYVDVRDGKGHKQRQVPISPDVYELVTSYLDSTGRAVHRTADRAAPLFLAHGNRGITRLTTRQARRVIVALARQAGLRAPSLSRKRITPHGLRHSYAIALLAGDRERGREGAPLPAVSKLMGHSSVAVTGRYLAHFERGELARFAPTLRRDRSDQRAP